MNKMAEETDFNRSGLTVHGDRAWYTGQRAQRIPSGLVGVVGKDCTSLDLSYNELSTITAVKDFPCLKELILDNNELRDLKTLPTILTLTTLSLNNNKISKIDAALEQISLCCPAVTYVSLLGNPGCPDQLTHPTANDEDDYERYRLRAIYVLPNTLRFLDSRPVSKRERVEAQSRGMFLKTVRPDLKEALGMFVSTRSDEFDEIDFHVNYTPLPTSARTPHDHKGAYGKCRYRYSGKNSEGNRFICNNDL